MGPERETGVTDQPDRILARRGLAVVLTVVVAAVLGTLAYGAVSGSKPARPAMRRPAMAGVAAAPRPGRLLSDDRRRSLARPLAGKIIGIDPGHNGRNWTDPAFLSRQIWNGRQWENCDTTGTQTAGGYTEARYNFNVARYLRADLRRDGARVVMTRTSNSGIGPCVDRRARIINRGHADVAVDIHADWAPPSGRGFAILEPVRDGPNNHVIGGSRRLGRDIRAAFLSRTAMPVSNYDGVHGIKFRDDLAGLNLTTVPKILIECGNMNNATDAGMLTSARFQRRAARALEAAIIRFLAGH
jgi:N-acetylmuramoyl-L-alanine amidase